MGYGFPRPIANEIDLSYYVDTLMKGISCVQRDAEVAFVQGDADRLGGGIRARFRRQSRQLRLPARREARAQLRGNALGIQSGASRERNDDRSGSYGNIDR